MPRCKRGDAPNRLADGCLNIGDIHDRMSKRRYLCGENAVAGTIKMEQFKALVQAIERHFLNDSITHETLMHQRRYVLA
jgi:hypothetical protein